MVTAFQGMNPGRGPRALRWLGWLFLLIGIGMLAGGGYAAWGEISFRQRAVQTDGRVVQMLQHRSTSRSSDGRRSVTWTPVFAFRLPDGREMRVEGGFSSSPPCCAVGEAVRLRYDPADPTQAQMTGFLSSWLVTTILGGIGAIFALVGTAMLGVRKRAGPPVVPGAPARVMRFQVPLAGLRRAQGPAGPTHVLQARWADPRSGVQRLFESEPLPFDPVPQMRQMTHVEVEFDPSDPSGPYRMDLSFLRAPS